MNNRILVPQHGLLTPGVGKLMDIDREPMAHVCFRCHRQDTLILPKGPGKLVWACAGCGMVRNLEWGKIPNGQQAGAGAVPLRRRPLLHECQDCGLHDWIVLPEGGGDLRWECGQCRSVWLIRFTPERWLLARVKAGQPTTPDQSGEGQ